MLDGLETALQFPLMRFLVVALSMLSAPVLAADACHDLWFTRNQIMDRAGYCFGTVLGQSIFDNRDCVGKSVSLDPASSAQVRAIQNLETRIGCSVNTSSPIINLPDVSIRRALIDLPLLDEFPGTCIGWQGSPQQLHAGRSQFTTAIGQISFGDNVKYNHTAVGNWTYVTVTDAAENLKGGGWLLVNGQTSCVQFLP